MIEGERLRKERRRRRDRRAQAAVVLLALLAGLVAGVLGTRRGWERLPRPPASAAVTTQPGASVP